MIFGTILANPPEFGRLVPPRTLRWPWPARAAHAAVLHRACMHAEVKRTIEAGSRDSGAEWSRSRHGLAAVGEHERWIGSAAAYRKSGPGLEKTALGQFHGFPRHSTTAFPRLAVAGLANVLFGKHPRPTVFILLFFASTPLTESQRTGPGRTAGPEWNSQRSRAALPRACSWFVLRAGVYPRGGSWHR